MRSVQDYSDKELVAFIENHEKKNATDKPAYLEALIETNRRNSTRLDLQTSIGYLKKEAAKGNCVAYGDLAEANGCIWGDVRYPMNTHLGVIVKYAHSKGWPMLSAIVVNKTGKTNKTMEPETLKGFIAAAKALKLSFTDERAFLREQQEACFRWGRGEL